MAALYVHQSHDIRDIVAELHSKADRIQHLATTVGDHLLTEAVNKLKLRNNPLDLRAIEDLASADSLLGLASEMAEEMHSLLERVELTASHAAAVECSGHTPGGSRQGRGDASGGGRAFG